MARSSLLQALTRLGQRTPGLEEIAALLDESDHAALLYDVKRQGTALANARAIQLTAFTRLEISELELEQLLPELSKERMVSLVRRAPTSRQLSLIQRSGGELPVMATFTPLGRTREWLLISLQPLSELTQEETEEELQKQRWAALSNLALAPRQARLDVAYQRILLAGQLLTSAPTLALYIGMGNEQTERLERHKHLGPVEHLPPVIGADDLAKLRLPYLWTPGKRGLANLHNHAQVGKLSYVATTPLDQDNPTDGLLVAADSTGAPPDDILVILQILASTIITTLQHNRQIAELQNALRTSGGQFAGHLLLDEITDGVIFLDGQLLVQSMNAPAELILGYAEEEIRGQEIDNVLIGAKSLLPALRSTIESGQAGNLGDFHLHHRDGNTFLANVHAVPLPTEDGSEATAVLISDLSEHEEFRLRTQQLEQKAVLGDVMARFAHEVRNPINNLSTSLQVMAAQLPEDDPAQARIERMREDCERLAKLMQDVLSFSGAHEYKMAAVDIGQLAKRILERWRPHMTRENVSYRLKVTENTPLVKGDQDSLERVLINLISNASKAMSKRGGLLSIRVQPCQEPGESQLVETVVSDTGPGIPEEVLARIFDPFFTTDKKKGTGLGLAITKGIINAHRGQIEVSSVPGGTVFRIKLPRADETKFQIVEGEEI